MSKHHTLTIKYNLAMEFLYSLFAVGTGDHFKQMIKDFNLEPNEALTTSIQKLKQGLSKFMESELDYFFDLSGLGYIFYQYILLHDDLTDIPELLQVFYNYDPMDLSFRVVESVCKTNFPQMHSTEYHKLQQDITTMISLVEMTEFQDPKRREKVMDLLKNPEETKQRFYFLLNQFYKNNFSGMEDDLVRMYTAGAEKYETMYAQNPQKFLEQYLNITNADSTPVVCISFFKYIGWHHYALTSANHDDWFILGLHSDLLFDEALSSERYSYVFKTLSDPNRIAILRLLSERSWYGQEIAEQLNITPATISYHMSFLQKAGFISYERMENRSYYCMNKAALVKTMEDFVRFLG